MRTSNTHVSRKGTALIALVYVKFAVITADIAADIGPIESFGDSLTRQRRALQQSYLTCGRLNEDCCNYLARAGQTSNQVYCEEGLTCSSTGARKCVRACGGVGQPCCAGNTCTVAYTQCSGIGLVTPPVCIQKCGIKANHPCCPDGQCETGFKCVKAAGASSGRCKACPTCKKAAVTCGIPGKACCSRAQCQEGSFCGTGNTCRAYCGHSGQPCCPAGTAGVGKDGCSTADALTCGPKSKLCTSTCGFINQACCPGKVCITGATCTAAGKCADSLNCGGPGKPCCPIGSRITWLMGMDADGCHRGTICEGGVCRVQCGYSAGQPCCASAGDARNGCDVSSGVICRGGKTCVPCGQAEGQPCCVGPSFNWVDNVEACKKSAGLKCDNGTAGSMLCVKI